MKESKMARSSRPDTDPDDDLDIPVAADLLEWVQNQMKRGCAAIAMKQRLEHGEEIVDTWELLGADPRRLSMAIENAAHSEGRYLRGPTTFALYASLAHSRDHVARKTIRVEGDTSKGSSESEPANSAGLISMCMRHTDASIKYALGHTSHIVEQYKGMMERTQRRVIDLEISLSKSAELRERLRNEEHEHAIAVLEAQSDAKNNDFLREQVNMLIPVVADKFLNAKVGRSPVVTDAALGRFLGSLSPEQMTSISSVLTPEQSIAIGHLYMEYAKRSNPEDAAEVEKQHDEANGAPTNGTSAPNGAAQ